MQRILETRDAALVPTSFDEDDHSIEAVWSTGARVIRRPWFGDDYEEELSMDPAHIRLGRMDAGRAPFLDSHQGWALEHVLGRVMPGTTVVENGEGRARIKLSKAARHADTVQDIRDGIIVNTSVGYEVHTYETTEPSDGRKLRRAVDWEPYEVSAVPMGADPKAHIRSLCKRHEVPFERAAPPAPAPPIQERETMPNEKPAETVDADAIRAAGVAEGAKAENARQAGIRETAKVLRLDGDKLTVELLGNPAVSLDESRAKLISHRAAEDAKTRTSSQHTFESGELDERTTAFDGMLNALNHRACSRFGLTRLEGKRRVPAFELSEQGRAFRGFTMIEMARECLRAQGISVSGLSRSRIAQLALKRRGMHSTSDFPFLLEDSARKNLLAGYQRAPQTFQLWAGRRTAPDFKVNREVKMGEAPQLLLKVEGAKLTYGTITEDRETWQLATYARGFGVTRETLVNDDLMAFTQIPFLFGESASGLESDIVYGILTANADMRDGVALFHADHGNLRDPGADPDKAEYSAMRTLMRRQTGLDGTSKVRLTPAIVVGPTTLETEMQSMQVQTTPANPDAAIPAELRGLPAVSDPILDDTSLTAYYMFADPGSRPCVIFGFLEGAEGIQMTEDSDSETLGMSWKGYLDFAAAAVEHRAGVKNEGT
jgi:hypothetical protein